MEACRFSSSKRSSGERDRDRAVLAEAGGELRFGLQLGVEIGGVFGEQRQRERGAELADEAGGMPRGAGGQALAFQQHDIGPAELGQVIGDRAADHAAADDDGFGVPGQFGHCELLAG